MLINFLNEYYKSRSQDNDCSNLINMYLEIENQEHIRIIANNSYTLDPPTQLTKQHGKFNIIAYPTDGAIAFNSGTGSVVRGLYEHLEVVYGVVDNHLYSYNSSGTRSASLGTLNTSTGIVEINAINDYLFINDETDGYAYKISTNTFTTVADLDFPASPYTTTAQDGYILVSPADSIVVQASAISDPLTWNALSFSSKVGQGDNIVKIVSNQEKIWVLGQKTTEVWYNDGQAPFAFTPTPGVFLEYGCAAKNSVAKGNNTIYMLARSHAGGLTVVEMSGYDPKEISNAAITYQINQLSTTNDAIGFCYMKNKHEYYVLTFPTAGKTFQYDISMGLWSERQSTVSGAQTRWIANCYCYCYGKHIIGAYNSGKLLYLSDSTYTEDGISIYREIATPPAYAAGKKMFLPRLQIDFETGIGANKTINLYVSYDSGRSYITWDTSSTVPDTGGRLFWTRLGMTQNSFAFKLTTTMDGNFTVLGAFADVEVGET